MPRDRQNHAFYDENRPGMREKFAWLREMAATEPQQFADAMAAISEKLAELQQRICCDLREARDYNEIRTIGALIESERKK